MQPSTEKKKRRNLLKYLGIVFSVLLLIALGGFLFLYFNGLSGLHTNTAPAENQTKIACVGDSITYGHGITNWPKNNYPTVLGNLLSSTFQVQNFGVSGCTVQSDGDQPYTATKRYHQGLDYNADIVILMMGSNDSKPENWKDAEQFRQQYNALIDSYIQKNASATVFLCTPAKPYYTDGQTKGLMRFDINGEQVTEIADIVQTIAQERNLPLIDIYTLTAAHPEWFEKDGVHPNNAGAAAIAEEIKTNIVV